MTVSKQNVHETRPQDLAFTFLKSQDLNLSIEVFATNCKDFLLAVYIEMF